MSASPRVLVTRPAGQCEALCDALTQAGFDVRAVPVIDIVPHADRDAVRASFKDLPDTDLLIFVSRNAVRHALADLPPVDDIRATIVAVGPATARELIDQGLRCDVAPEGGFTSEALLAHSAL
ncbi:MAG: uroporphyrinogen-III synthase, partial [Pseudomonadota bacterium]